MTRWATSLAAILLAITTLWAEAPKPLLPPIPKVTPKKIATPPKIDGALDDPVWKTAPVTGPFTICDNNRRQVTDTRAQVAYDDKWLYLSVECDNPHMKFLEQHGKTRDGGSIFHDDSISVLLTREGLDYHFEYVVSFANVQETQKLINDKDGKKDREYGCNRPWVSATKRNDKGWTAEIAIPLDAVNGEKPGDVRLNLVRNKIEVKLNAAGEKESEKNVGGFWSPVNMCDCETERFGALDGLKYFRAGSSFLPQISSLKIKNLDLSDNAFRLDVVAGIVNYLSVGGKVKLKIVERTSGGEKTLGEDVQDLSPRSEKVVTITVPVTDFSPRTLVVKMTDQSTDMRMDELAADFSGKLIAEAYPELSFYSKEKTFRVKAVMSLSEKMRRTSSLELIDAAGKMVTKSDDLAEETILSANADVLKLGKNVFTVALKQRDGKTLESVKIDALRLPPGKGSESKVDHFNRVVRFNGEPFFPFGICANDLIMTDTAIAETVFSQIASSGMNMFTADQKTFSIRCLPKARTIVRHAAKHGLLFGLAGDISPMKENAKNIENFSEKQKFLRKDYSENYKEDVERVVPALRDEPNLLFWQGLDKPSIKDWRTEFFIQRLFYENIKKEDPYHIIFGNYVVCVPSVPETVEFFDALGYQVCACPNWDKRHTIIYDFFVSKMPQVNILAAKRRQPLWLMLTGTTLTNNPKRCPRPLTGQEQHCQSYAAIIYGAKGLLYDHYVSAYGEDTWVALRTLGDQLKTFAPAVLNEPVAQTISYASGNYDIFRYQYPPIPFRCFRYPDGRLMALAVNAKNYPVDVTVKIEGLRGARKMFGDKAAFTVTGGQFSEKLEPLAVCAYALDIAETTRSLTVFLTDTAHPEQEKNVATNFMLFYPVKQKKNLILNPSLEEQKVSGLPDFYAPFRMKEVETIGKKGSRWFLDTDNPKFGKVSLRMEQYSSADMASDWIVGAQGSCVSLGETTGPYILSFYARAAKDGEQIWVSVPKKDTDNEYYGEYFTLTKEWKRYFMAAPIKNIYCDPSFYVWITSANAVIWMDGFQLEQGGPTEFSE